MTPTTDHGQAERESVAEGTHGLDDLEHNHRPDRREHFARDDQAATTDAVGPDRREDGRRGEHESCDDVGRQHRRAAEAQHSRPEGGQVAHPEVERGEQNRQGAGHEEHLARLLPEHVGERQPERLEVLPELPRTASGKIQKFRLRDQVGGGS
jgi:acyl-CoA synthetase (AMP-forming)/AMP-acid ligase II